jgi:hypothetical protein
MVTFPGYYANSIGWQWHNHDRGDTLIEIGTWTCPSCQQTTTTAYCPRCGERPLRARELTLRGLLNQVLESLTNIDGRVLRTLRFLVSRPGMLTVAYLEGLRKPFVGPVQLFLLMNVLFFATDALTGGTVFATPLDGHLYRQPWSETAQVLIANRLQALNTTAALYAPRFDAAIAAYARTLILVMVLAFAALPWLVFKRRARPFVTHAVFSLHLYAFILLLLSVGTTVPAAGVPFGGERSTAEWLDAILSVALLTACGIYLHVATGAVYGGGTRVARVLTSIGLAIGTAGITLGYRFGLLLLTLYSTA